MRVVFQAKVDPARVVGGAFEKVRSPHHRIPLGVCDRCEQFGCGFAIKLEDPVLLFPLVPSTAGDASSGVCEQWRLLQSGGQGDQGEGPIARRHEAVAGSDDSQRTVCRFRIRRDRFAIACLDFCIDFCNLLG